MEGNKKLVILYGSETGTVEQEARMLYLQCKERGFEVQISTLDDYPLEDIPEINLAVFLVSTTGMRSLIQAKVTHQRT